MHGAVKIFQIISIILSILIIPSTVVAYRINHETYLIAVGTVVFISLLTTIVLLSYYKRKK